MSERKSRTFWVINDGGLPVERVGYECPPNEGMWWFPSPDCHFSTGQVFENERDARKQARKEAEKARDRALALLARIDSEATET